MPSSKRREGASVELQVPVHHHFASIEFPGPVRKLERALDSLGGLPHLSKALLNPRDTTPTNAIELQLNAGPQGVYTHPVPSTSVSSGNVVLRLTKRKRKRPLRDAHGNILEAGVYSIEPLGVASQNIRFRANADYKVQVDQQDPAVQIANAVRAMDIAAIQAYRFPAPTEHFTDDLFLPPPAFARHTVPLRYEYRPVVGTVPTTSIRPSGHEISRLAASSRYKPRPLTSIAHSSPTVPSEATEELYKVVGRKTHDALEIKLLAYLERRPVWTRQGLLNQLEPEELRIIQNHKIAIPMVSYTFLDGPFKELVIRFSYDPRIDPEARLYQHIVLRNAHNVRTKARAAALTTSTSRTSTTAKSTSSHLFDGQHLHSPVANYQLVDITDPLIVQLVRAPEAIHEHCSPEPEGWYKRAYFEQIRAVLKRKFVGLVNGTVVEDEMCGDLLGDPTARFGGSEDEMSERSTPVAVRKGGRKSGTTSGVGAVGAGGGGTAITTTTTTTTTFPWEKDYKSKVKAKQSTESEAHRSARLRKKIGLDVGEVEEEEEEGEVGARSSSRTPETSRRGGRRNNEEEEEEDGGTEDEDSDD